MVVLVNITGMRVAVHTHTYSNFNKFKIGIKLTGMSNLIFNDLSYYKLCKINGHHG